MVQAMGSNWGTSLTNLTPSEFIPPILPDLDGGMSDYMSAFGKKSEFGMGNYGSMAGFNGGPSLNDGMGWGSAGMGQAIGMGMAGIQGLNGIANAYLGMKNYGLAKDTLASNKQQYWNNFTSQARLTNAQLRDRQTRRVAGNSANQDVDSYMKQNGINETGYR